jgi:hypothetical protein
MSNEITIDKVRHLRYTANAIADIEEITGEGLASLLSKNMKVGVRHARAFLWGGLKHEDRRLSTPRGLEIAGDMIETWYHNGGTLDSLYVEIFKALKNDGWMVSLTSKEIEQIEDEMGEVMAPEKGASQ